MITPSHERQSLLKDLLAGSGIRRCAVRMWDGTVWQPDPGWPRFTVVLRRPDALRRMLQPPLQLSLGEAYLQNEIDVEGDLEAVFPVLDRLQRRIEPAARPRSRPAADGPSRDGLHRDKQAVAFHYDRSNEFFALWLDRRMVYSCAYFSRHDEELDLAQEHKLEYLCRKMRLKPGERMLDIGCGWGALLLHAAGRYGVHAHGITLSRMQAEYAAERIRRAGLADRCRVDLCDYRELAGRPPYDKIVSVGMVEHVGHERLPSYFGHVWDLLRPGGVFLNHGISLSAVEPPGFGEFISRYVFPDAEVVPVHETLSAAERCGFEVRDVESLREHYYLTLRRWSERLDARREEAIALTDERTFRTWKLYLAGAAHHFNTGRLNVHQAVLVKSLDGRSELPLRRSDWYAGDGAPDRDASCSDSHKARREAS